MRFAHAVTRHWLLLLAGAALVVLLGAVYLLWHFGILFAPVAQRLPPPSASLAVHVYDNPAVSLERIKVQVIYLVPQDRVRGSSILQNFPSAVAFLGETLLPQLEQFHTREWGGHSTIQFSVYPKPVIGKQSAAFYARDFLSFQSARPLEPIQTELEERLFHPGGDLYDAGFVVGENDAYTIQLFIFDAPVPLKRIANGEALIPGLTDDIRPASLVFAPVVGSAQRGEYPDVTSIIYHELLHAMGVPEQYDAGAEDAIEKRTLRSDIMGIGADLPLSTTYIAADIKEHMGVRAQ